MSFIKGYTKNHFNVLSLNKRNNEFEKFVELKNTTEKFILTINSYIRYIYYQYEEDYYDIVPALKVNS